MWLAQGSSAGKALLNSQALGPEHAGGTGSFRGQAAP